MRPFQIFVFFLASLFLCPLLAADTNDLAWPEVKQEQKPWIRWWWPGSAVDKPNLTRELEGISAAGFGGVEITPIYGAKGYESRFIKFLSPDYVAMLGYTAGEAKRLGLAVDMATGTGWPFGGPQIRPEDAELRVEIRDGKLVTRPTGFKVKRSAPGGEGFVVDPYSPAALEHYLEPFTQALSTLPPGAIHSQFHDSFEYTANWANELPEKFRAMHGYDLRDHAAELGGQGDPDTIARIKSDYRETVAQLHLDYIKTWVDWSHRLGETAREQAHGAPGNLLDLYAAADIPETEIFGSSTFPIPGFRYDPAEVDAHNHAQPLINRFASSAAHVAGRPLASSETFTWLREHFHESPSEMKPEVDQLFLTGINHVFYHGDCYSPADAPWPGWVFYAATQFNPRNSLWPAFAWLNTYITRCQSLLQAGRPDNDLLIYWPVYDLWHKADGWTRPFAVHDPSWINDTPCGKLMNGLIAKGYSFDLISDAQLGQTQVENDELKTPGGSYRAILVPPTDHMPVETFSQLVSLARAGATILFMDHPPADVPGFGALDERRARFKAELMSLSGRDIKIGEQTFFAADAGSGLIAIGTDLETLLSLTKCLREPLADSGLGFIRRRTDDGEIYFVANLTDKPFDGWTPLSHAGRTTVLLDALSGRTGIAEQRSAERKTEVYLQLQPGESIFIKTLADRSANGPPWNYTSEVGPPVEITGKWHVIFTDGGPSLPPAFTERKLHSWTDEGGEAERFAGTARYEIEFNLPKNMQADDWLLDLGDVRETARVFLNGKEVDHLWSLPFRTHIGSYLKPGRNTLALEVTNLSANRIRDLDKRGVAWKNFYEINFVNIAYKRFDASTWPLQPSGLFGPIRLVPLQSLTP